MEVSAEKDALAALRDRCDELKVPFNPASTVQELMSMIVWAELQAGFTLPECHGTLYSPHVESCRQSHCLEWRTCKPLTRLAEQGKYTAPEPVGASEETVVAVPEAEAIFRQLPPTATPPQDGSYRLAGPGAQYGLPVGTILRRTFKGHDGSQGQIEVKVVEDGFLYLGEVYKAISKPVALFLGKRNFSGPRFFNLGKYNPNAR